MRPRRPLQTRPKDKRAGVHVARARTRWRDQVQSRSVRLELAARIIAANIRSRMPLAGVLDGHECPLACAMPAGRA